MSDLPKTMKAVFIVREGSADRAFEIRETPLPVPGPGQVLIKVEAFGLNFADVMARLGQYRDRPSLPSVVGYDVVGEIVQMGEPREEEISMDGPPIEPQIGMRVVALTRFGGYAEYAVTDVLAFAPIAADMDAGTATALATQYSTAWVAAEHMVRMYPGDHVLIQAAAGGVGTALVQLALYRGCTIYGTAGSEEKLEYLRECGVHHPINYRSQDFEEAVRQLMPQGGIDLVFDSIGGKAVKKAKKLLGNGGRLVLYGGASATGKGFWGRMAFIFGFGFYHPGQFIMKSQSMIGVNMLTLSDHRPEYLARAMSEVSRLASEGVLRPKLGATFKASEIARAHQYLQDRKSIGKIAVYWQ